MSFLAVYQQKREQNILTHLWTQCVDFTWLRTGWSEAYDLCGWLQINVFCKPYASNESQVKSTVCITTYVDWTQPNSPLHISVEWLHCSPTHESMTGNWIEALFTIRLYFYVLYRTVQCSLALPLSSAGLSHLDGTSQIEWYYTPHLCSKKYGKGWPKLWVADKNRVW